MKYAKKKIKKCIFFCKCAKKSVILHSEMEKMLLNMESKVCSCDRPQVMGIVNITPDSFAVSCRSMSVSEIEQTIGRMVDEGADILDLGAMSSRPGYMPVSVEDEWCRLAPALEVANRYSLPISVDTYRSEIARRAIENGATMINDIYGGDADGSMFPLIARTRVPYILMCARALPSRTLMASLLDFFAMKVNSLRRLGATDIILDPGFGFGKTTDDNFTVLRNLGDLQCLDLPILVGVSRKSMVFKTLGCTPAEALNGTTAIHMASLLSGASILRVHDVKQARETVELYNKLMI